MATPIRGGWKEHHQESAERNGYESWEAWIQEIEERRGRPICGRMRRNKKPCARLEAEGVDDKETGACWDHGGESPAGALHPNFKHGRRVTSNGVGSIRSRLEQFMSLDARRALQVTLATQMVRVEELLDRLDQEAVGPRSLSKLRGLMEDMRGARAQDDPEAMVQALLDVESIVTDGAHRDETWRELMAVLDGLRQSCDTWRKLMVEAQEMVERSRVLLFVDRLAEALLEVLQDLPLDDETKKKARREVAARVGGFLNAHASGLPASTSD